MKKFITISMFLALLIGCGNNQNQGELIGIKGKKFFPNKPFGMVEVPGGTFIMGSSDEDIIGTNDNPTRTVTLRTFYMDETEITNGEYRQFVEWVKDSIVRTKLAEAAVEEAGYEFPTESELDEVGIYTYFPNFQPNEDDEQTAYQTYLEEYSFQGNFIDKWLETFDAPDTVFHYSLPLNKDPDIEWDRDDYVDAIYASIIEDSIYLPESEWFNGEPSINTEILRYRYSTINLTEAAQNPNLNRSEFVEHKALVIYPDTTVWIKDFKYSYNEPMHNDYFWHRAYSDYPVVGVSWEQAKAFAHWRSKIRNDFLRSRKKRLRGGNFRLPTEAEWEYAARGGLESAIYPWGGPYLIDDRACFLANFKPRRGDYAADNSLYTVEADSYQPNDYGLYNMSGNVSEWTITPYYKESNEYVISFNPYISNRNNRRKVVRGGSWKDVAHFLKVATRDYEYADSTRSYIGFRLVRDFQGSNDTQ